MSDHLYQCPYPQPTDGWDSVFDLPVEARFAARNGVEPISTFIWDGAPKKIEASTGTVAFHQLGTENGTPLLSFHGNPGSARGPHPTHELLEAENIRLIAFDAPGFGESDFTPSTTPFAQAAHAAKAVVDTLGLNEVAVFARSGGVPRALGFAALYPEHVSNMILVAGVAPPHPTLDWREGMTDFNKTVYEEAGKDLQAVADRLSEIAVKLSEYDLELMGDMWKDLDPTDQLIFELQPDLAVTTAAGHAFGTYPNAAGWIQNALNLEHDWGFSIENISVPIVILHGADDPFANIAHARSLRQTLPNAKLVELEGGHFVSWQQIRKQLRYLADEHIRPALIPRPERPIPAFDKYFNLGAIYDNCVD